MGMHADEGDTIEIRRAGTIGEHTCLWCQTRAPAAILIPAGDGAESRALCAACARDRGTLAWLVSLLAREAQTARMVECAFTTRDLSPPAARMRSCQLLRWRGRWGCDVGIWRYPASELGAAGVLVAGVSR